MGEVNQDMLNALRNGEQTDFDGIMVKVSRQACEEGADLIELQDAELRAYKAHNSLLQLSNDAMAEQHEKDQSLITELVGALEAIYEADNTGPVAHEVNEKGKAVNWHNTKGRSAEIARAALTKAKEYTK